MRSRNDRQRHLPENRRLYRWWYDHVQSRYYDLLMTWCFWPFGGERRLRAALLDGIDFRPGEWILELCCGTGNSTLALADRAAAGARIVAIDLSLGQVRRARTKSYESEVAFLVMDASALSFADGVFDKVFIPHALHEMPKQTRMGVLREAGRVLAPNGEVFALDLDNPPSVPRKLLVGFWFFYWLPFNFETATRRDMFEQGLDNEIRAAGFQDVTKRSTGGGVFQVVRGRGGTSAAGTSPARATPVQ